MMLTMMLSVTKCTKVGKGKRRCTKEIAVGEREKEGKENE